MTPRCVVAGTLRSLDDFFFVFGDAVTRVLSRDEPRGAEVSNQYIAGSGGGTTRPSIECFSTRLPLKKPQVVLLHTMSTILYFIQYASMAISWNRKSV